MLREVLLHGVGVLTEVLLQGVGMLTEVLLQGVGVLTEVLLQGVGGETCMHKSLLYNDTKIFNKQHII